MRSLLVVLLVCAMAAPLVAQTAASTVGSPPVVVTPRRGASGGARQLSSQLNQIEGRNIARAKPARKPVSSARLNTTLQERNRAINLHSRGGTHTIARATAPPRSHKPPVPR